ncbi:MAG TPA: 4Fe-4S binding protein [Arachnia sp.]|nr:4Fe-4S binding protein [Arachnia sp.]
MTTTTAVRAPRKRPSKAQLRTRSIRTTRLARAGVQLAVAGIILFAAVRHQLEGDSGQPSVDALCPFGAVETLVTLVTTGQFISKTHPSNIVLGLAVLAATLLVGNVFCGWICPWGAVQDALSWVRGRLHLKAWQPPADLDRWLRHGRFVVLGVVVYFSVTTAKLWFADFDPYVQTFGLGWVFNIGEASAVGLTIVGLVLLGSLVIDRMWCRYLCPLGAVFSVVGHLSFLRIRRTAATCTDCTLCDRPCPVGLSVSTSNPKVSTDCIGCMDCVTTCPVPGALKLDGPVFLGSLTRDATLPSRPKVDARSAR